MFYRFHRRALRIGPEAGGKSVVADFEGMRLVLGWLVHIAMKDGMTRLALGVNREKSEPWMRFFGPFWHEEPVWYDMVPPETYCYPVMLQVCISLANLDEEFPLKGVIPAVKGRKHLNLEFEVDAIDSFRIGWDKRHAEDRRDDRAREQLCKP